MQLFRFLFILVQVPINLSSDDKTEHLRIISIQDVSGTSLLFLANNFREAELLVCGLKLLLERETARLGVRGGLPITALGGKAADGAMSPAAARGFRSLHSRTSRRAIRDAEAGMHHRNWETRALLERSQHKVATAAFQKDGRSGETYRVEIICVSKPQRRRRREGWILPATMDQVGMALQSTSMAGPLYETSPQMFICRCPSHSAVYCSWIRVLL